MPLEVPSHLQSNSIFTLEIVQSALGWNCTVRRGYESQCLWLSCQNMPSQCTILKMSRQRTVRRKIIVMVMYYGMTWLVGMETFWLCRHERCFFLMSCYAWTAARHSVSYVVLFSTRCTNTWWIHECANMYAWPELCTMWVYWDNLVALSAHTMEWEYCHMFVSVSVLPIYKRN